ncbi:MAG: hypothetical protein ACREQA_14970, partial [Candidatus Binatia bacterium]
PIRNSLENVSRSILKVSRRIPDRDVAVCESQTFVLVRMRLSFTGTLHTELEVGAGPEVTSRAQSLAGKSVT